MTVTRPDVNLVSPCRIFPVTRRLEPAEQWRFMSLHKSQKNSKRTIFQLTEMSRTSLSFLKCANQSHKGKVGLPSTSQSQLFAALLHPSRKWKWSQHPPVSTKVTATSTHGCTHPPYTLILPFNCSSAWILGDPIWDDACETELDQRNSPQPHPITLQHPSRLLARWHHTYLCHAPEIILANWRWHQKEARCYTVWLQKR